MAAHNQLGRIGEELAVRYLVDQEHKILETNYRFSRAEVDIITKKGDLLIFVEVKARSTEKYGKPEQFVSRKKMHLLMDAAYHYMEKVSHDWEIRFDVIAIIMKDNAQAKLTHIKDAFIP